MRQQAYLPADVEDEYGIQPWVPIDARVKLGNGRYAIITEEAKNCDCGKGVYCPLVKVV